MSVSFTFALLLLGGIAAQGLMLLILLIMLMVRSANMRPGG
jgi:hypothetical protein